MRKPQPQQNPADWPTIRLHRLAEQQYTEALAEYNRCPQPKQFDAMMRLLRLCARLNDALGGSPAARQRLARQAARAGIVIPLENRRSKKHG
ncbi:MAG: hypothetical protein ACP5QA_12050 [Phycisphaerae bacterium]